MKKTDLIWHTLFIGVATFIGQACDPFEGEKPNFPCDFAQDDFVETLLLREAIFIPVTDNDSLACRKGDIDPSSLAVVSSASFGTAVVEGGGILYTPGANFGMEIDLISYEVATTLGQIDTAVVTIRYQGSTCIPILADDEGEVSEGGVGLIFALDNDNICDESIDAGAITIVESPSSGVVELKSSADGLIFFEYQPGVSYGTQGDLFTYSYELSTGASDTATVNIKHRVCSSLADDQIDVQPGAVTLIDVLANDNICAGEIDLSTLTITNLGNGSGTTEIVDGMVRFTPGSTFDTLVYTISTLSGVYLAPATVILNYSCSLLAENDAIDLFLSSGSIDIPVVENDYLCGEDITSLEIEIVQQPAKGEAYVNGSSGTILYIANPAGALETDVFSYRICDGQGNCSNTADVLVIFMP
ncbi:hyalin domain secreted protein [Fulvivirga imtechensis AK7]|uniref:Hyalin domain secreted protein n=1 Tax=Fulvivirga imtechensis AK7 TaxID=1237149 RepID=L8JN06_9BACT|nr:Ig-like domain-containing protein [Fulvivirga imtechensis]ELR68737.1 hyalin domain secreted protein [Fulvivirga imtechensis AK7]